MEPVKCYWLLCGLLINKNKTFSYDFICWRHQHGQQISTHFAFISISLSFSLCIHCMMTIWCSFMMPQIIQPNNEFNDGDRSGRCSRNLYPHIIIVLIEWNECISFFIGRYFIAENELLHTFQHVLDGNIERFSLWCELFGIFRQWMNVRGGKKRSNDSVA